MSRLDHSIILAGRQPNIVNAFAQGQQARARADEYDKRNALRRVFQTQGKNILAGDPEALGAVAQYDPGLAVEIRGHHQVQTQRAQKMDYDRREMEMILQERMAKMESAEVERELAGLRQGVAQATFLYEQGDLNGVNQILQRAEHPPLQSLQEFPEIVAKFGDAEAIIADFLKPKEQGFDNFRVVGGKLYDLSTEGGPSVVGEGHGQGFNVTTPDGTTVSYGGSQQGPGFGTKATNEIEGRILDSGAMLGRLNDTKALFKPEYLELATRIGAKWGQLMDKMGSATPEQQELVANFAQFKTEAFNNLNTSLKELSGAAVTPQEAERLLEQLPSVGTGVFDGDSPTEFQAKLEQSILQQQRAVARYNLWLATGRQGKPWEMGSLDDVDKMINARGAQIEKQLKANGISDPQVLQRQVSMQLRKEVGF